MENVTERIILYRYRPIPLTLFPLRFAGFATFICYVYCAIRGSWFRLGFGTPWNGPRENEFSKIVHFCHDNKIIVTVVERTWNKGIIGIERVIFTFLRLLLLSFFVLFSSMHFRPIAYNDEMNSLLNSLLVDSYSHQVREHER